MLKDFYQIARIIKNAIRTYYRQKKSPVLSFQEAQRKTELKKMEDPRRVDIYNSITLTEEQLSQIDTLFTNHYGCKVPYVWHKHYTAFTGAFDTYYFPELLYIPEFEFYMNQEEDILNTLEDKNFVANILGGSGVRSTKNIISCTRGVFRDSYNQLITKDIAISMLADAGRVFLKPTQNTSSGKGCFIADFQHGKDTLSQKNVSDIFESMGDDFAIQEIIICHDSIRKIYAESVNTFRVITYIWNDEICFMPTIMRIGQGGSHVDNAHAGGMFIAVSTDGFLHETAFTEFKTTYTQHPDTGVVFKDYHIPNFEKILNAAKKLHSLMPQVGVVNWDFTIDQDGEPVFIEANTRYGGIWVIQMAHGKGPFGNRTPEILNWLRCMNSLSPQERVKYRYGKTPTSFT